MQLKRTKKGMHLMNGVGIEGRQVKGVVYRLRWKIQLLIFQSQKAKFDYPLR